MSNSKGFMKIIILALVVIFLLVVAYFFTMIMGTKTADNPMNPAGYNKTLEDADIDKTEQIQRDAMEREKAKEEKSSVFENVAKGENSNDTSQKTEDFMYCNDTDCFKEQFTGCSPSGLTLNYPGRPDVTYYYETVQKEGEYCKVKSYYLAHKDSKWIGPEMVCLYNNHIDFQQAVTDTTRCEGELYDLMRGQ